MAELALRVLILRRLLNIMNNSKKVILIIMDGFALSDEREASAIAQAKTPVIDNLLNNYPWASLKTSGIDVGLMAGQMGDSNVGHLNIGAGRVVWQLLPRIMQSIEEDRFYFQPLLIEVVKQAERQQQPLHIMGLMSDGGVHSHINEVNALLELVRRNGPVPVKIHMFLDGRDVPPRSAKSYLEKLEEWLKEYSFAEIASVSGRYYAMDRDQRWERTKAAVEALVNGQGQQAFSPSEAIQSSYNNEINDEFVLPTVIMHHNKVPVGTMNPGESVIFINFRADRARQITKALLERDINVIGMAEYEQGLTIPTIFPPIEITDTLGEVVSKSGLKQLRVAETEKYAHVTFFLNGGREEPYSGEERILVPSPKVATYDLQPEMSADEVTTKLLNKVKLEQPDLVVVNFANCDMVGHTGIMKAAIKAVEAVDRNIGRILNTVDTKQYSFVISADHGNAEQMQVDDRPHTAHTNNEVPCIIIDDRIARVQEHGRLADIAPTVLDLMGLAKPDVMTGVTLLK